MHGEDTFLTVQEISQTTYLRQRTFMLTLEVKIPNSACLKEGQEPLQHI